MTMLSTAPTRSRHGQPAVSTSTGRLNLTPDRNLHLNESVWRAY
jgi:hypothetical protein